jgi:hypothetical protein
MHLAQLNGNDDEEPEGMHRGCETGKFGLFPVREFPAAIL